MSDNIYIDLLARVLQFNEENYLAGSYDKKSGKMENYPEIDTLIKDIKAVVPMQIDNKEAASKMRHLEDPDNAIEQAGEKVIDLRDDFRKKIAINKGAMGLIDRFHEASTDEERDEVIFLMKKLAEASKNGE